MRQVIIIQNIYGYIICLIAIIILLFSVPTIIEATIDTISPEYSDRRPYIINESFESWKTTTRWRYCKDYNDNNLEDCIIPPDEELRPVYDEEKITGKAVFIHENTLVLIERAFLLIVTIILFIMHWSWLRKINKQKIE